VLLPKLPLLLMPRVGSSFDTGYIFIHLVPHVMSGHLSWWPGETWMLINIRTPLDRWDHLLLHPSCPNTVFPFWEAKSLPNSSCHDWLRKTPPIAPLATTKTASPSLAVAMPTICEDKDWVLCLWHRGSWDPLICVLLFRPPRSYSV